MLLRKLQDLSFKMSAYHGRLRLQDLQPGSDVMVMQRVSFWGKSRYEFTGVVIATSEEVVMIRDKSQPAIGTLAETITERPANLGLTPGVTSFTFILASTWQNRLTHIHLG